MQLKSLELEIRWPKDLPLSDLRLFILDRIRTHGEPLRWSISYANASNNVAYSKILGIEAVVIID